MNIEKMIEEKKKTEEAILDVIRDKSKPLGERWEFYTTVVNSGLLSRNESYGDGYIDILGDNISLYDDFYIEKHETSTFLSLLERVEEDPDASNIFPEDMLKWKEAVLQSGYSSFTYDW